MQKFKVIDIETGIEVSSEKIEAIARDNGLFDMDVDQFFVGEDGQLILVDDCGNMAYCDQNELGLMPVFEGKYPDLEYLERIFLGNLKKTHPAYFNSDAWHTLRAELTAMFPQTWPNTAGGFPEPGMLSGQAITTQITTVMEAYVPKGSKTFYGVFFGNRPAYIVDEPNNAFLKDLKNRALKSVHDAKESY